RRDVAPAASSPRASARHDGPPAGSPESSAAPPYRLPTPLQRLIDEIQSLEDRRRAGVLTLPNGDQVSVGHLEKAFWPHLKITKGELLRYDVAASPLILPAVK